MKFIRMHRLTMICTASTILSAAMLTSHASAATLVNDSFLDNERSTQLLPTSVQWFGANATTTLDASSGALVVPAVSSSGALGFFMPSGAPLTMSAGDSLQLSFTLTTPASGGKVDPNTFLYGLLNSGGTRPTADGIFNSSIYNNDVGYLASAPLVGAHGARNTIVQRTPGSNNLTLNTNYSVIGTATATPNLPAGGTYAYSLLLELGDTQMTLTSNMGGVEVVRVDEADLVTSFDSMFIFI